MEIIYYVAASLDGFIATPDGGIDWLKPFEGTGEDYGYGGFYASIEAVLLGRVTYEQCLQFSEWPRRQAFRLKSSRSYPNGIVQLRYETVL